MEETTWVDVTQEIFECQKDMKLLELIKDDDITLQQCMQSQQINDDKMDPKFNISSESTINYYLSEKKVKLPSSLSVEQIQTILATIFQLQASVLKGSSLTSTIYTFSYLYDNSIYEGNILFTALIESIFCLGSHIYTILKDSCAVKEDDVNISIVSYLRNPKSHQEIIELILQAEKFVETQLKKNGNKEPYQFILACLRVRRMLHNLAKSTGKKFEHEKSKKILEDIQLVKKRLNTLKQLPYDDNKQVQGIFFKQLSKTIRGHFGPRKANRVTFNEALEELNNTISHFETFLPIPQKIHEYKHKLELIQAKPYNAWGKAYIKASIFAKQDYVYSVLKTADVLINDIDDWIHLKENFKNSEKFHQFIKSSAQVVSETLYRLLGNNLRWQWECSRVYEDFNVIVHMANELDFEITSPNRQLYICSWFYYYGLNLMIKQMLVGFQIKLYHPNEAKPVFYVLENIIGIFDRNSQIHLRKIDKVFLLNFKQGNFNKKLKKKMNENSKRMFADIIFKKGLHLYFKALFRLLCILHDRKLIENKFESTEEIRIKNRFKIFKNIMFIKVIEYGQYCTVVEDISKRDIQILNETIEDLKEVKNTFQLFTSQFDENQTFFNQKIDADFLIKSSIKASLVAMTLKMKAKNKQYVVDFSQNYPEITIK